MRTLHFALRVRDRERSLAFYTALGYEVIGEVPDTEIGHLTMLKLPADEFVAIELVSDSPEGGGDVGSGLSHFAITVTSLKAIIASVAAHGITVGALEEPASPDDVRTSTITDPDGNRIELVQWPAGHPDGLTAADWRS